ncbi:MAG: hypothetical protein J6V82_04430 [Clostridia bacterium]|nr:hypothetical protein [Bacteroidales bacterium]MBO5789569.1 hypothetical protein [Clostridia bacterium]MBO7150978.1 hypothetical protein [Clostridia bacterium]
MLKTKYLDLTGQRYGRLVAIKRITRPSQMKNRSAWWLFKCDCGAEFKTNANNVRSGRIKSCGCWQRERLLTHGKTGTKLFGIWCGMRQRCSDVNNRDFQRYGGRGITVCDEWQTDFRPFYNWAIASGYADSLTIDRIDVNGNYEPSNCRWATRKEQANNRRTNIYLTYEGDTFTLAQWAERTGIAGDTLSKRLYRHGWSIEKALTTPVRKQRNNVRCSGRSA